MIARSPLLRVLVGSVVAAGAIVLPSLQAAEKKPVRAGAAQGGKVFGIVTAKTDKDITIKAEGEDEAKRYLLAPQGGAPKADLQAALKTVFPTNLVMFQSQGEQDPVLTGIQAIHSKTESGTVTGTVVAVDANPKWPVFDVRPASRGHTERYVAAWNPATKSCDQRLVQIIAGLSVGDKVKVAWSYDERKRAIQIQVVGKAKRSLPRKRTRSNPRKGLSRTMRISVAALTEPDTEGSLVFRASGIGRPAALVRAGNFVNLDEIVDLRSLPRRVRRRRPWPRDRLPTC